MKIGNNLPSSKQMNLGFSKIYYSLLFRHGESQFHFAHRGQSRLGKEN